MKFLIAGFGSIGRRHFRNLLTLGERDILLYRTYQSTLQDDELAGFLAETDLKEALAHKPDAVIVSNPTAYHLDVAIPAAEAGCHILIEKPVSYSMERMDTLENAVQRGGGHVLVGFQFRFHPGFRKVASLLSEGVIGRPLSVRAHWGEYLPDWHPWEDYRQGYSARTDLGGGVILTLCHPLDYLCWLFGDVEALWAFSGSISDLKIPVEDTAEIGLRFANGIIGSVHLDYNQRPPAHTVEIVGTQGTIQWDYSDGAAKAYTTTTKEWEVYPLPEGYERNDMFLTEMRHFIDVVCGKATSLCTLDDGIRVQGIIQAVKTSSQSGQMIRW
ncbi:MAG: Gfo/Idh/MocA family oxidoreductase [Chloroflexota bacterium]